MPRLSFYVLKQLAGPTALFTLLLTAVIWLTQSLHLLDLVINRGQSAPTFLYLTLLLLPSLGHHADRHLCWLRSVAICVPCCNCQHCDLPRFCSLDTDTSI